jgi:hypothetical protein
MATPIEYTFLKEITVWTEATNTPNHTYILNQYGRNVGYIKTGTKEEIIFTKPSVHFSKSHRKFITLKKTTELQRDSWGCA